MERLGAGGAAEEARSDGFLWVWLDGSTFRRCDVTSEPREIWSKTAPMSEEFDEAPVPLGGIGGGGGGGPSNEGNGGGRGGAGPVDGGGDRDI